MDFRDLKYLAAFIIPGLVLFGLEWGSYASYSAFVFAFVLVPIVEPLLSRSEENLEDAQREQKSKSLFFDLLLYLNIPIVYFLLYLFALEINIESLSNSEMTGHILSFGVLLASCGINVGHELGHKDSWSAKAAAILLLTPCLYNHFYIEHNRGHHKNVATADDPATAKKGELLYLFWLRSLAGSYLNAWRHEFKRLESLSRPRHHISNLMYLFTALIAVYLVSVYLIFGQSVLLIALGCGIISVLFLETINYVEHYGLQRRILDNGRYERVQPWHSWNSNHYLGRIILYELTRHSDHHYLANKKYQLLDHHDSSPELPFGYPSSMLIAMVPPLWFRIMDKRLEKAA